MQPLVSVSQRFSLDRTFIVAMCSVFVLTGVISAESTPLGFHPASTPMLGGPEVRFENALDIGAKWTRESLYAYWFFIQPDLNEPNYVFDRHDRQWRPVPEGINVLANIAPQGKIDMGYCLEDSYFPIDEAKYVAFVEATVERYDGDGTDDMPNLASPIKYWQVGNEPHAGEFSDFAALQQITYEAVKTACPDCTVLIGGARGSPRHYINDFNESYAEILTELAGQYVDVFDFHWYGRSTGDYRMREALTGKKVYEYMRDVLTESGFDPNLPIWITEMSSYSGDPNNDYLPAQSESQQAGDYIKRFVCALAAGVEMVFPAFGLMEGFKHDDGYFDHTGLIYDGYDSNDLGLGVKKLAYYAFKKTNRMLGGSEWSSIKALRDGTDGDHLYLFGIEKFGRPLHIAWWDHFDDPNYSPGQTKTITLTSLIGPTVTLVDVVPDYVDGLEVSDFADAFTVTTYPVVDGSATIVLGEDMVLVQSGFSGDLNNDRHVDLRDFSILAQSWLKTGEDLAGDLDRNGRVDAGDLGVLPQNWLSEPD